MPLVRAMTGGFTPPWPSKTPGIFVLLLGVLIVVALAELAIGPVNLSLQEIIAGISLSADSQGSIIVSYIRAPRLALGLVVGTALALSGCALQGVLRNPLADPGLIGVSTGASVGALSAIVFKDVMLGMLPPESHVYVLPIAAFAGAGVVTGFVFSVSRRGGATSIATLILAGVAVNAIALAMIGSLIYISDDQQLRDMTFWMMGSLGAANWTLVTVSFAIVAVAAFFLFRMGRELDLFQLGERAAYHSGLDTERTKRKVAVLCALAVGGVTAAAGPIGFIGLMAPHMARLIVGPRHALVLPAAALMGTILLLMADLGVRNAVPPAEPPIGLATSMIGGPFFLWLLLTRMKRDGLNA
ncbi:MAG: iron ABC transporter permease [Rhodospirillales bacterium]|nr:iron ABC transporter permease [Rhodospirillales bacterium]MBO6785706.1 iron ABC transporter permease [Rhodospirillales bacterium]